MGGLVRLSWVNNAKLSHNTTISLAGSGAIFPALRLQLGFDCALLKSSYIFTTHLSLLTPHRGDY